MKAVNHCLSMERLSKKYLNNDKRTVIACYIDISGSTGFCRTSFNRLEIVKTQIEINYARYFGFYEII